MYICTSSPDTCGVTTLTKSSAHTYLMFPSLQKPENSVPVLLTWSTMLHPWNTVDSSHQLDVLREWARSEDGQKLYEQSTRDVQDPQDVEQLALTMAALMNYRRLFPDVLDCFD